MTRKEILEDRIKVYARLAEINAKYHADKIAEWMQWSAEGLATML